MIAVDALKDYLKVDPDVTADDVLIGEMEEAAVAFFQNETGRYYGPVADFSEVLSTNGWASIWLAAAPLPDDEYTPVLIERRSSPGGDWETVPTTEYEIDGQRLYPLTFWRPGVRTLRASYWAGYEEGAVPSDVQQAVRELVARMYDNRSPVVVATVAVDLPYSVRDTIRAHRLMVV